MDTGLANAAEVGTGTGVSRAARDGYRVFNRVVDWITQDRVELININDVVRKSGICDRRNADSHLRGMILGQTLCLQVRNSAVLLGKWQSILLAEFDGPRSRSLSVQVSGI